MGSARFLICFATLFVALSLVPAPLLKAENTAQSPKQVITNQAIQFLNAGEFKKALYLSQKLKAMNPKDPAGYRVAAEVYWRMKEFAKVVFEVYHAERNYGVRSIPLYKLQTQALYWLGGLSATHQSLDRIENLLREQMKLAQGQKR